MSLNITIPGLVIINGVQGGGKSHCIKYIMHEHQKEFNWGLVFTQTAFNDDNFDYMDKKIVHCRYNEQALIGMKKIHESLIKQGKRPRAFVIFDDCIYEEKQWRSPVLMSFLTQLRHYNVFCIISTQHANRLPPEVRTNAFGVLIFTMATKRALDALYESYGMFFDNFDAFKRFVLENTENHQFIYYNTRIKSAQLEDKYQVMKCPGEIPAFKVELRNRL
jgi:hypothetical protein